ncbi:Integrase core domain-containing protein [Gemmobacter aquatilis]|uniref:Integrase core domain-containing protein n=1 Tax=Gemmobacter aquatilis TaxID=933059 RepID=A0A1H8LRU8_9RHOB|nr:integrase core domain-containing protein [Gemmobacter aquatilis]SEO07809.1 Integrase core domain-containing protein [Gemmobacter aquatilis]
MIAVPAAEGIAVIMPDNGMVERVIRTLKEQCIHRQRFDSIQHATRAIGDWISFYNNHRPHQALDMKTPAEAFALAA